MENGEATSQIHNSGDVGQQFKKGKDEGTAVTQNKGGVPSKDHSNAKPNFKDDEDTSSSEDEEEKGDDNDMWDRQFAFAHGDHFPMVANVEDDEEEEEDAYKSLEKEEKSLEKKDEGSDSSRTLHAVEPVLPPPASPLQWDEDIKLASGPEHREERIVAVADTKFNKNIPMDASETWDFSLQALDKNFKSKVLWIEGNFYQSLVGKCLHEMHNVPCACEEKKKLAVCRLCHVVFCSNQCFKKALKKQTGQDINEVSDDGEQQELIPKEVKPLASEPPRNNLKTESKNFERKARPVVNSPPESNDSKKCHSVIQRDPGENKNPSNNFKRAKDKDFYKNDQRQHQQQRSQNQGNRNNYPGGIKQSDVDVQKTYPPTVPFQQSFWPTQVQVTNAGYKNASGLLTKSPRNDGAGLFPINPHQESFVGGRRRSDEPVANVDGGVKQKLENNHPTKILRNPGKLQQPLPVNNQTDEESKSFFSSSRRGRNKISTSNTRSHSGSEGEPQYSPHNFSEQGNRQQGLNLPSNAQEQYYQNKHRNLNNENPYQSQRSPQHEHYKMSRQNDNINSSTASGNVSGEDHSSDYVSGDGRTRPVNGDQEAYHLRNNKNLPYFQKNGGPGSGKYGKHFPENAREFGPHPHHDNQNYRPHGQPPFLPNEKNFRRHNGRFGSNGGSHHESGTSTGLNVQSENEYFSLQSSNRSYMSDRSRQDGSQRTFFNKYPSAGANQSTSSYYSAQSGTNAPDHNPSVLNIRINMPSGVTLPVLYMRGKHFDDFGVILPRNLRLFKALHLKLQGCKKIKMEICDYGNNCLVKYPSNDFDDCGEEWYRAQIIKNVATTVGVYFVDLGVTAVVSCNNVYELPKEFNDPNPLGLRIRCLNVKVDNNDSEVSEHFDMLVREGTVKIRITHKDNVEMFRLGCHLEVKHLEKWFDAGVLLKKLQIGGLATKDDIYLEEQKKMIIPLPQITLREDLLPPTGDVFPVKITHVISPNEFYITDQKLNKVKNQLEAKLNEMDLRINSGRVQGLEDLSFPLFMFCDKKGSRSRVKVVEVAEESAFIAVVVQKVDDGEILTVRLENLVQLPPELLKPSSCVYKCSLPVKPNKQKNSKSLFENIRTTLQGLKEESTTVHATVFLLERSTHFVDLYLDTSKGGCTSSFVKNGWADLSHEVDVNRPKPETKPPRPM